MEVSPSFGRRMIVSLLLSATTGILLTNCPLANSQTFFSGITSMETRANADGSVQIVDFQADFPFEYQKQVLDSNTVLLRLYNARLANNLVTPEGGVNLLAGGTVKSARLKQPKDAKATETFQEIILSGPDLGRRTIQVLGAKELSVRTGKTTPAPKVMMARAAASAKGQRKASGGRRFSNINAIALSAIDDANEEPFLTQPSPGSGRLPIVNNAPLPAKAQKIALDKPVKRSKPAKEATGPQITAIKTAATHPLYISSASTAAESNAETEDTAQQSGEAPETNASTSKPSRPQVITVMPRYTGGAKPIQAVTLDKDGHPMLIQPKNKPIPELSVGKQNGGYNTLFQAEPEDKHHIVQYMQEALNNYRTGQYEAALSQVQKALLLDANNADVLAALAEIQMKQGQTQLAEHNYYKAQTLSKEKYGPRYAQILTLNGSRLEAIQVLESLYRQNPKQVQVAYMLGTLHEELGQTSRAMPYLQQAAELHPGSADIQFNLGLAYELSGDRLKAEKHYRQALHLNPKATDVTKALARVRQGNH